MDQAIRSAATWLWGPPMLILLSVIGVYFTIRLRGLQFTHFTRAAKWTYRYRVGEGEGNITPLQSLFSALGGMIGNGNIAGVATAIAIGGPGSVFWFWLAALIAMIIVYVETKLAVTYRKKAPDGTYSGGPMYYIEHLLHMRWLAALFAFAMGFKTLCATATIQSNSISLAAQTTFHVPMVVSCLILAFLTWIVIIGGLRSIARTLEKLTPFMVLLYLLAGGILILTNITHIGNVLSLIVTSAFTPASATGGFAGATVMMAIRYGVARGFYSNEAGTGSSPIMYSTAISDNPEKLSHIGMFGVVIDTVVCTFTALLILITGVWSNGQTSTALTTTAFNTLFGQFGGYLVFAASFLFGYSTLIAWCFYGEQCFVFLFGPFMRKVFRWAFCFAVIFGFMEVELLWSVGDLLNGFTVIVNGLAIFFLVKYVIGEHRSNSAQASS